MSAVVAEAKKGMQDTIKHFMKELKNLRTNRANPGMLENVMVEVYGSKMNLKSLGTISVLEGRQLLFTAFDPQTAGAVAKGIEAANLGLQAILEGHLVRVPVPPLSEEVRKDIVKFAKKRAEDSKISIREVRKKCNDKIKKQKTDGLITEDQVKRFEKDIQELTDKSCKEIDTLCAEKEKDILQV